EPNKCLVVYFLGKKVMNSYNCVSSNNDLFHNTADLLSQVSAMGNGKIKIKRHRQVPNVALK
ncbi:hypothetical protein RF656_20115, partial [Yersinia kristensenii]|uniref:hypothetical protein n=1 Tax=Yersinia kristensenii TaxID=28152 RepID=UPI002852F753